MLLIKILLGMATLIVAGAFEAKTIVFSDVNLIAMTGEKLLANQTVVVRGDRIIAVGSNVAEGYEKSARFIDGKGKYLIPGLAEMHGHTPIPQGNVNSAYVNNMMFLYVANGVTTLRGMLGAPAQLILKEQISNRTTIGPSLYLAGPSFNGNSISSPEQARQKVRTQVAQGWDLLKVHPGLSRAEYDAMANTAHQLGIHFGGHVPRDVGLEHAISMGQLSFDHIDGYLEALGYPDQALDFKRLNTLVKLSKDRGVWIVPTLELWNHLIGLGSAKEMAAWPEMQFWPREEVETWSRRMKQRLQRPQDFNPADYSHTRDVVLKALHDAGVGILMGTDSPQLFSVPGFSIHREMQRMVEAGLTPYEVLLSGTRNVGKYFQAEDAFGVIAPGQRADMILLNANPLEDIAAVKDRAGVLLRGVWFSEEEIQVRLTEIKLTNKN